MPATSQAARENPEPQAPFADHVRRCEALLPEAGFKRLGFNEQSGLANLYLGRVARALNILEVVLDKVDEGIPLIILGAYISVSTEELRKCPDYATWLNHELGKLKDEDGVSAEFKSSATADFIPPT